MILALEGPDYAGKTTLFNQMKTDPYFSGWKFISISGKMSKAFYDHIEEFANIYDNLLYSILSSKENYVFDRFMISNFVYAAAFNRTMHSDKCRIMLHWARYVYLTYDFNKRNFFLFENQPFRLQAVENIVNEYEKFFNTFPSRCDFIKIDRTDFNNPADEEVLGYIKNKIIVDWS